MSHNECAGMLLRNLRVPIPRLRMLDAPSLRHGHVDIAHPQRAHCSTMHDELKAASKSPALSALIAVAVARAVALLCHRASALMASGSELRTIGGPAVAAQLLNISLCSQLHEVQRSLLMMLPKLAPAAAEVRVCLLVGCNGPRS